MTNTEIITPLYIIEQAKILSEQDLLVLIENYGNQEYERAAQSTSWDYH